MRRVFSIGLMLALAIIAGSSLRAQTTGQQPQPAPAAEEKKKIAGTWAGTYEGDSSGKFEMIFSTTADGKDSGKINVMPDDGDSYSVDLKTLTFDGTKLLATYTLPQGGDDEIMMEGTFGEAGLSGKWAVGTTGNSTSTGTWKASKK